MNKLAIIRMSSLYEGYSQFQLSLDDIISPSQAYAQHSAADDNYNLLDSAKPETIQLLSVQDGLSFHISRITDIRKTIRSNIERGLTLVVDYPILHCAVKVHAGILEWKSRLPQNDFSDLIEQMLLIYLLGAIYPLKYTSWVSGGKIASVVREGVALLQSFPPRDPVQTVLLAPTFIIGCGAFDPAQRSSVRSSICTIREYTMLKDTNRALEILEQVWRYMDQKDEKSWDWQSIAHEMRI